MLLANTVIDRQGVSPLFYVLLFSPKKIIDIKPLEKQENRECVQGPK